MRHGFAFALLLLASAPTQAQTFSSFGPTGLSGAFDAAMGPDGRIFVADNANNRVLRLDADGTVSATIVVTRPYGLAFSSAGDLFVSGLNTGTSEASIFRVTTPSATPSAATLFRSLNTARISFGLAFAPPVASGPVCTTFPGGSVLYVARSTPSPSINSTVLYLNADGTTCGTITATASNLQSPLFIASVPARNSLLAGEGTSSRITEISLATGALTTFFTGTGGVVVNDIALNPPPATGAGSATCTATFSDGRIAYVATRAPDQVLLVDANGATCATLTSASFGGPTGLAFDPAGALFVTNATGTSVSKSGTQLPVELVSFTALAQGSRVALRWATASETNNAGFDVEVKRAGAFTSLGAVSGRGTTTEANAYAFTTGELAPGRYAFRLRQTDFDGVATFSAEVEAVVGAPRSLYLSAAYPNPSASGATVTLTVREAQRVRVEVRDVLGRAVAVLHDGNVDADAPLALRLGGTLPSGTYFVRATGARFADTRTLTVVR